jgi:cobalt-zinc-cadmium efflux system membrane fusion protein
MYVEATIITKEKLVRAIPEAAVITEGTSAYIFVESAEKENEGSYHKVDVLTGLQSDGWCEIQPLEALTEDVKVVIKGAYYLSAEMGKEG